ncbi:unnamed protein product [Tenebrio molitor]|nr:unnamed protein product [Tenebrio molitor]
MMIRVQRFLHKTCLNLILNRHFINGPHLHEIPYLYAYGVWDELHVLLKT